LSKPVEQQFGLLQMLGQLVHCPHFADLADRHITFVDMAQRPFHVRANRVVHAMQVQIGAQGILGRFETVELLSASWLRQAICVRWRLIGCPCVGSVASRPGTKVLD
jgi:hypothetical protein